MPVYAYQCRTCNHTFEARQSFTDAPLTDCPSCETEGSVFRVVQPAGVVFKGSGWYITDSRSRRESVTGSVKSNGSNGNGASESANDDGRPAKSSENGGSTEAQEKPAKVASKASDDQA